jgi:hypothetical protein
VMPTGFFWIAIQARRKVVRNARGKEEACLGTDRRFPAAPDLGRISRQGHSQGVL